MLSLSPEEGNAIKKIQLSLSQRKEKLIWKYDKKGDFSAKSGYWVAKANQTSHSSGRPESSRAPKSDLWRSIWSVKAAPKVKAFLWKLCSGAPPLAHNLEKRENCFLILNVISLLNLKKLLSIQCFFVIGLIEFGLPAGWGTLSIKRRLLILVNGG
ncbi:putative RNA binding protein [Corchorus olitorius]|uniref:RNA binding protein n=1 Tax=Corchorus olitorius TaxID=93759 RepID=A0A1R3KTT3_9ROSI|nr:putative RNA binding protein [Corchorus olitorius]